MRIAIIGGGCSGLTAARRLLQNGYRKVTLYEADDRIGGKIHSVKIDNQVVELGAVAFPKDNATMFELARERLGVGIVRVKPKIKVIRRKPDRSFEKVRCDRYWSAMHNLRLDVMRGVWQLWRVIWGSQFRTEFDPGFSALHPEFMNLTMTEFARKHNFHTVVDPFYAVMYACGYGAMEEVPALYLLKMMKVLEKIRLRRHITFGRDSGLYAGEGGNQALWSAAAVSLVENGLNLRLDTQVTRVVRRISENGSPKIEVTARGQTQSYDRLFLATSPDKTLEFVDASAEENDLLRRVRYFNYNTVVFRAEGINRNEWVAIRYNMTRKRQGRLFAYHNDARAPDLFVGYQFNNAIKSDEQLDELARRDITELGGTLGEIILRKPWKHFPHVKLEKLDADYYLRLNSLQGERGTYYLGGIFAFDTTGHCADFAKFIVNRFCEEEASV